MAKKRHSRTARHKAVSPDRFQAVAGRQTARNAVASVVPAPARKPSLTEADLANRYRYVASDLKRSFIIAGSMFLLLIVLHFLLR